MSFHLRSAFVTTTVELSAAMSIGDCAISAAAEIDRATAYLNVIYTLLVSC